MTRGRSRIVALQAVVVGGLMVVVFLTLLAPEGENPLFGIETPGEQQPLGPDNPPSTADRDPNGPRDAGDEPRRAPGAGAVSAAGVAGAVTAVVPSAPAPASPTAPLGGDSDAGSDGDGNEPSDDQYGDAVARLVGRLGSS